MILGKEGCLFFDGEEMVYIKIFEVNVEKNKFEVNIMGCCMIGYKIIGVNGIGIVMFYKVILKFVILMMDYVKKGSDFYFML